MGEALRDGGPFRPGEPELSASPKGPTVDANGNPIPGNPNLLDTRGPIDRFTDLGFDAQYQFIGKKHLFTLQTSYVHEDQQLNDTFSQDGSLNKGEWLDKFKINANYYYRTDNWGTVGGTVAYVNLWGSGDPVLYSPGAGTGFRTGKPNSDYWIFELDYVPWWKQLSPSSPSNTPSIATLMALAASMTAMPGILPMECRLTRIPFPGATPPANNTFISWSGRRFKAWRSGVRG